MKGNDVTGVLAISQPWPSMARSVYNNHHRYLDTYLNPYKGHYFTGKTNTCPDCVSNLIIHSYIIIFFSGDGATRDKDGYIFIRGRVDGIL